MNDLQVRQDTNKQFEMSCFLLKVLNDTQYLPDQKNLVVVETSLLFSIFLVALDRASSGQFLPVTRWSYQTTQCRDDKGSKLFNHESIGQYNGPAHLAVLISSLGSFSHVHIPLATQLGLVIEASLSHISQRCIHWFYATPSYPLHRSIRIWNSLKETMLAEPPFAHLPASDTVSEGSVTLKPDADNFNFL